MWSTLHGFEEAREIRVGCTLRCRVNDLFPEVLLQLLEPILGSNSLRNGFWGTPSNTINLFLVENLSWVWMAQKLCQGSCLGACWTSCASSFSCRSWQNLRVKKHRRPSAHILGRKPSGAPKMAIRQGQNDFHVRFLGNIINDLLYIYIYIYIYKYTRIYTIDIDIIRRYDSFSNDSWMRFPCTYSISSSA